MRVLLISILMLISCNAFAQSRYLDSLRVAVVGADTSFSREIGGGGPTSLEFDWSELDGVDTLYVYGTNYPDSLELSPLRVDVDLDGVNDNPWTLSDSSSVPPLWSLAWPWDYVKVVLKTGTSTSGRFLCTIRRYR